jgi:formyltetrahydrofolate hydrolase
LNPRDFKEFATFSAYASSSVAYEIKTSQEMQKMGQDIEKVTLAKGLQYHLEDRVLTCNNKTVVFS